LTVNDFVRNTFLGKQNGEIQFWQEMVAGGTAGASQVVSWEKNRAKFLIPVNLFITILGVYQSFGNCKDSSSNPR
jgi:hypothetical protein